MEADADFWELKVGDETKAVMSSESTAKAVIQYITDKYSDPDAISTEVTPSISVEKKSFKKGDTAPELASDGREVAERLIKGNVEEQIYTIEAGDNPWLIANSFGVTLDSIYANNPGLNDNNLQVGQQITIRTGSPDVSVRTVVEKTVEEEIDYETIYEETYSLAPGVTETLVEGEKGIRTVSTRIVKVNGEVESQEELASNIQTEPVASIVKVGVGTQYDENGVPITN